MKNKLIGILSLTIVLMMSGCKDKVYRKYMANSPIYTSYEEFRNSIKFESPHNITTKGQIYIKDSYLFVTDPHKGIHVIDNSNPASPNNIGFIKIIGNTGFVIKGNYLYANALIDMVVIDITNITAPKVVGRIENIFPDALPLNSYDPYYPIAKIDSSLGVVTAFEIKEVTEETNDNNNYSTTLSNFESSIDVVGGSSNFQGQGISGSITKITMINNYVYVMEGNHLIPIDVSNPFEPKSSEKIRIWRTVETLFAYQNHIFMGTTTGMLIYETSSPNNPTEVSVINHLTACDPVVVQGNYAYVTIRSGNTCAGVLNQLDVVDVSDFNNPILKASFQFINPHGLGIDGDKLFICDGTAGLKVLDATNPLTCGNQLIKTFDNIQATDVIPHNNIAIVIGDDGIYQYDYSDIQNLNLLSVINF